MNDSVRHFQVAIKIMMALVFVAVCVVGVWSLSGCDGFCPARVRTAYDNELRLCAESDGGSAKQHECIARARQCYGER